MTGIGYSTEGFDRSVLSVGGVESVVYAIGDGPAVVYLHGGGTFHGFEWARDWGGDFRVILPHHPNFGESGDADFAAIGDYAAHYVRLFDAMRLERFHLVGASMGGLMAAEYAARDAARVDRLVLVAPAGLISQDVAMPDFSQVTLADFGTMLVHDPAFVAPFWPADPPPEWLAMRAREGAAAARTRADERAVDARLRKGLAGIAAPALLLWGDEDRILPRELIGQWQHALPHSETAIVARGGHLLLDESLAARNCALEFLRG